MNNIYVRKENDNIVLIYKDLKVPAYIGKNGFTKDKTEGDWKTPIGEFELGIAFGKYDSIDTKLPYIKIEDDMYWVDDVNSDEYNELIKTSIKPMFSAEHLIDYVDDAYEYAIEIKTNPDNINGKGSAIFLHCKRKEYTAGCVAIEKEDMKKLIGMIDFDTKIIIEG